MSGERLDSTNGLRRFRRYAAYKDSGVEWLGNVPAHWDVKRLKYLASVNPESLRDDTEPDREIVYVDIGGVNSLGQIVEREQLNFSMAPSRARRLVRHGDVIVSTVRTYLRAIAPIRDPEPNLVVSTGFAVVRPDSRLRSDYAAYALRAPYFVERVVSDSVGVSFPAINEGQMATFELAIPPEREQMAISAFLDRETARIDALIQKKECLIELLKENRTAAITRAVTKGLDASVAMKNPQVEWLGDIPAHWEIKRLRYLSPYLGVGVVVNPSQYIADVGVPFLYGSDVREGRIWSDESRRISPADSARLHKSQLHAGDLVMVRVGAPGVTAVVPDELVGANCASILIIRKGPSFESRWLSYVLNSRYVRFQVEVVQYGAAQEQFNVSHAADFVVARPPLEEQSAIVEMLDHRVSYLNALATKVTSAIPALRELRGALISAAVTGKIDIRQEVA